MTFSLPFTGWTLLIHLTARRLLSGEVLGVLPEVGLKPLCGARNTAVLLLLRAVASLVVTVAAAPDEHDSHSKCDRGEGGSAPPSQAYIRSHRSASRTDRPLDFSLYSGLGLQSP